MGTEADSLVGVCVEGVSVTLTLSGSSVISPDVEARASGSVASGFSCMMYGWIQVEGNQRKRVIYKKFGMIQLHSYLCNPTTSLFRLWQGHSSFTSLHPPRCILKRVYMGFQTSCVANKTEPTQ